MKMSHVIHRDLGELKLLLAERHGRCHVLQNNPKERQADAIWNVAFHTEGLWKKKGG